MSKKDGLLWVPSSPSDMTLDPKIIAIDVPSLEWFSSLDFRVKIILDYDSSGTNHARLL